MTIRNALLGFLSWRPLTGYDLKKLFADSAYFHWSGNNNQIYRTLVELHREGLVTQEVQYQESHPPRKVYTITEAGRAALREGVLAAPELPQIRHPFLVQLAWADQLDAPELDALLGRYEEEVEMQLLLRREQARRGHTSPARTAREAYLWRMIAEEGTSMLEHELAWVRKVRQELGRQGSGQCGQEGK